MTINCDTGQHSQFLRCFSQKIYRARLHIRFVCVCVKWGKKRHQRTDGQGVFRSRKSSFGEQNLPILQNFVCKNKSSSKGIQLKYTWLAVLESEGAWPPAQMVSIRNCITAKTKYIQSEIANQSKISSGWRKLLKLSSAVIFHSIVTFQGVQTMKDCWSCMIIVHNHGILT